ncbi:hypothetical protein TNIN_194821 [Trichonephila inaurata madagascariensis]|uniref:Uncharacterized protein n=1 Tax=Trichonephila inaurata madagascariensis TaxID=2747483 RepID=A0A8X6YIY3_9ARAC|nr:hypothetical protein TNIN_194821 [Trichonephila inaurata madagascariensis]
MLAIFSISQITVVSLIETIPICQTFAASLIFGRVLHSVTPANPWPLSPEMIDGVCWHMERHQNPNVITQSWMSVRVDRCADEQCYFFWSSALYILLRDGFIDGQILIFISV